MLSVRGVYENGKVSLLEPVPYKKKRVEVIVTLLDEESDKIKLAKKDGRIIKTPRPIGLAKDVFHVPESFFEELPEELLNAFEGKSE